MHIKQINAKIGLMYASDYYYVASPNAWLLVGHDSFDTTKNYQSARNMNWMYMGLLEWTIYRASNEDNFAFYIYYEGGLVKLYVGDCVAVRHSFYFETSVTYINKDGSQNLPIRIN